MTSTALTTTSAETGPPRVARAANVPSEQAASPLLSPVTSAPPVTAGELQRAWQAVLSGQFRDPAPHDTSDAATAPAAVTVARPAMPSPSGGPQVCGGPVVVVAGCHGWSGASTAALLLAEGLTRAGVAARVLDAAGAARSGLVDAAVTEHGWDPSRRWRLGSRGDVAVHRAASVSDAAVAGINDLPLPPRVDEATVTVLDAGRPVSDLLTASTAQGWLAETAAAGPLLLTARASVPGLRLVEATLQALPADAAPVLLLLGAGRRWLQTVAGPLLPALHEAGRVHLVPQLASVEAAGLTPQPLPRQLAATGDRLAALPDLMPPGVRHHPTSRP